MCEDTEVQSDLYLACRHLKFRKGRPAESEPEVVTSDLCKAPSGVIALLDCPVWLGRTCRFFEERAGDPEPVTDAELERLRERLLMDYMRWPYRKRIRDLARTPDVEEEAGVEDGQDDLDVREIAARPEGVPDPDQRKARFPGDAPSGQPPSPVEVDLDNLPAIVPAPLEAPTDEPQSPDEVSRAPADEPQDPEEESPEPDEELRSPEEG